ncbi:MAG: hypothetical protein JRH16_22385 [Deltaproteobacteria bacterium]|nr:hypothetical protein [Deltaproteobacteria bacterium]MBW2362167.1 hypothetical protein [Deltaproteobacteria bacterium]
MRDAIELEWAGIPSVAIIHTAVEGSARAMAKLSGVPDYDFILVDYPYIPTAIWSEAEIRDLAKEVAPRVLRALTA